MFCTNHTSRKSRYLRNSLCALITLASYNALSQESISPPFRPSNLASDSFWTVAEFGEGCCILDMNVMRWNGTRWAGGNSGNKNSDDFTWNAPIYSPANGEVASCWRNFPDNPKQGSANKHKDFPDKIFTGGNHVVIVTDEGNSISLNHFKQGTIPVDLCPSNSGSTLFPSTMKKEGSWRIASFIKPGDRPKVREGQLVGRAGNSGNSSGPHLHWDFRRVTGTDQNGREKLGSGVPLPLRHAWAHPFDRNKRHSPKGWFPQQGDGFSQSGNPSFKMLHGSPYLRRSDATAGAIGEQFDTLFLSSNRIVTATVGNSNGKVKLVVWDLVGDDSLKRRGDFQDTEATTVRLSQPVKDVVLAATVLPDQRLKMTAYRVSLGNLQKVAEKFAGRVSALDMTVTGHPNRRAVTALRQQNGTLKLVAWDVVVDSNGKFSIVRLGETSSTESITKLAITSARNFSGVMTALRVNGDLNVIPWKISDDGKTFTRGINATAQNIGSQYMDLAALERGVMVGVEDSSKKHKLITWAVDSLGNIGSRQGSWVQDSISHLNLLTSPLGDSNITSVVRNKKSGNMHVVGWAADSNGGNLRRLGSLWAGPVSGTSADVKLSLSASGLSPREFVATTVRTKNRDMKVIVFESNMINP